MTTETDHTHSTEPDNSWSGYKEPMHDAPFDPQAATEATPEELADPEPDQLEPPAASADYEDGLAPSENWHEPVTPATLTATTTATGAPAGEDHLLAPEAESDLLSRWTEIQISFVEDPRASVQEADALVEQIATTVLASIQERRSQLAAVWQWQHGQPDTEQLRLALRQYRSFIAAVLPV
jgi:hypothetical protein